MTSSTPSSIATPRHAPSPPDWPSGPSGRWPDRWPNPAPTCSIRHHGPGRGSSSWWSGRPSPPATGVQVLWERASPPDPRCSTPTRSAPSSGMLQGPQIEHDTWLHDITVEEDEEGITILFSVGPEERHNVPIAQAKRDIYARMDARPDAAIRLGLRPTPDPSHRGPGRRGARLRMATVRAGAAGPSGDVERTRWSRWCCPTVWCRSRSTTAHGTFSLDGRGRLRPAGRRWGPG